MDESERNEELAESESARVRRRDKKRKTEMTVDNISLKQTQHALALRRQARHERD